MIRKAVIARILLPALGALILGADGQCRQRAAMLSPQEEETLEGLSYLAKDWEPQALHLSFRVGFGKIVRITIRYEYVSLRYDSRMYAWRDVPHVEYQWHGLSYKQWRWLSGWRPARWVKTSVVEGGEIEALSMSVAGGWPPITYWVWDPGETWEYRVREVRIPWWLISVLVHATLV